MHLTPGTRLGPYEVQAPLGAGGMGEVYRATDTNLGRLVAIKVLPEIFARDVERLARFEREAKTLATLNHPNIAQIYGLEKSTGVQALVLELVEGPTLADRIAQGPIPADEAIPIAKQIAEALEAAHEHGIIHRDLKPANIKVRPDGTVKVLDFGLAKLTDPAASPAAVAQGFSPAGDLSQSPTITSPAATRMGVILGTAAYMSPEQAKGKPVDRRADIWAFGAVLYEMLTGRRAFGGDDVSDTLARVLMKDPEWDALPADTPPALRSLVRRCLERDPRQRLRDIGEARLVLEGAFDLATGSPSEGHTAGRPLWLRALPLALATLMVGIVAGGLGVWALKPSADVSVDLMRFTVTAREGTVVTTSPHRDLIISPDGRKIVYRGVGPQLHVRAIDQLESVPLQGTDGGAGPFVSPDGEWVGFVVQQSLQKVSILGGPPIPVATLPFAIRGAVWGRDDRIIVGSSAGGLFRVRAGGGEPEPLTTLDAERGESSHVWPSLLPDGNAVLFTVAAGGGLSTAQLAVLDLDTREVKPLGLPGVSPQYASSGHLAYAAADASLRAVPFDASRREVTGNAVPLIEGVAVKPTGAANFSISDAGRLVYETGTIGSMPRSLVWVDRTGREEALRADVQPSQYIYPRISPDGDRVAFVVSGNVEVLAAEADVWVIDLARGSRTRVTFGGINRFFPVWTPDGTHLAFSDNSVAPNSVLLAQADGAGEVEILLKGEAAHFPTSFARDGRVLAFYENNQETGTLRDLWILPIDGDRVPAAFLLTPYQDRAPKFSPDGRWIAYVSDKSGRDEVYVRPYPSTGPQEYTISTGGGVEPVWSPDARELFYRNGDQMMVVAVETAGAFRAATPQVLFTGRYDLDNSAGGIGGVPNYDVAPDGKRFVMVKSEGRAGEGASFPQIHVVLNWLEELRRLVPAN